jgi:PEGA domain
MRVFGPKSLISGLQRQTLRSLLLGVALVSVAELPAHAIVRRRLNVNSNPQGALVYVDNQQIGTTPCSVDFTYYGTREIRLIKAGFETLTVNQPIPAPWYQYTPIDFVSENLVTMKIRDNRTVNYNLAPQLIVPTQELIDRANQLRQDTLQYGMMPVGGALPITNGPAPVVGPGAPVVLPPGSIPEPLPGINPPPFGQPTSQQTVPAAPPGGAPLLPPRL